MIVKIFSVNPLFWLLITKTDIWVQLRWRKNGNKYLIFDDSANENKAVLKKYNEVWDGIKNEIKAINGEDCNSIQENDYGKDYMKIKFNSDDDLPLKKPLKSCAMTTIIRSVFEDGKFYLQVFLNDALYELRV